MVEINCKNLICPVCGEPLLQQGGSLVCSERHTYDIARQGYVNLLPVQQKHSISPGDTVEMLTARRNFLNGGHYTQICGDVITAIHAHSDENAAIVDVGCGEGYYTSHFLKEFPQGTIIGADVSKAAVKMACSRTKSINWIVATASHMPIIGNSVDIITAMFSLVCEEEFSRILHDGGCVIEVTAGTNHLIELKQIIYDDVFEQHKRPKPPQGFLHEVSCELHSFKIMLDNLGLINLLNMTPHTLRIKPENRARLESTPSLELTAEYFVRVLQK